MEIKVIVEDGVIRGVLKDCSAPVNVELIDTSECYEDHAALEDYAQQLFSNPAYKDCNYKVANFKE